MLKLSEYGEINYSKLMSYCGLNNHKHREIVDDMVAKNLITRTQESWGNKTIIKYRMSEKGREILREVLEPYEALFSRVSERAQRNVIRNDLLGLRKTSYLPLQKLSSVAIP
jgi:predicted transcriptional regulator